MTIKFELRRVIIFTVNFEAMSRFYGEVLGLALVGSEEGFRDYAAGGCGIALHEGKAVVGQRAPKLAFYASDVAAARAALVRGGLKGMGKVKSSALFDMCDGVDPDGNRFQISGRK